MNFRTLVQFCTAVVRFRTGLVGFRTGVVRFRYGAVQDVPIEILSLETKQNLTPTMINSNFYSNLSLTTNPIANAHREYLTKLLRRIYHVYWRNSVVVTASTS